jgi:hypothetical protein
VSPFADFVSRLNTNIAVIARLDRAIRSHRPRLLDLPAQAGQ